jgi:hypothetical protein
MCTIYLYGNDFENYLNYRAGLEEYRGNVKCATKYETQLRFLIGETKSNSFNSINLISLTSPTRSDSLRTKHFTLHWDEAGPHAVPLQDISNNGIPDYIDTAAVVLEHVWDIEINQLNYSAPPEQNGQPTSNYHVYFSDMSYYGLTTGSGIDIPSLPGINWTSYLELENDYQESIFYTQGLDGLRVTAAHEFHHAIQFGYNVRQEDFYFYEMTSTWMEDVLYDDINDYYNYLSTLFFNLGNRSFDDYSLYSYGNCLYVHMLDKKIGPDVVRGIWNQIKSETVVHALSTVLQQSPYNWSWVESLAEYGVWLYYTGDRAIPALYFPEGVFYPQINKNRYEVFDFSGTDEIFSNLLANSNKYIKLQNIDNNLLLNLQLTSDEVVESGFNMLKSSGASAFIFRNDILQNYQASQDSIIFVISNASDSEANFTMHNITPQEFKINQNYPNPFNNKTQILVELINNTKFSLKIYNEIGEEIKVLQKKQSKPAGFYFFEWNGENESGRVVSSGIYFASFESNQKSKVIKLIFIK